ncbi:hypothetical protein DX933_17785 [Ornithinibacillus gellani]|uniref:CAP domain-containing protein n=1 Tax=Ornithinibacillus gellani TaxID=2293253 RepID=UPI000F49A6A7|nr:CAP domain-containing protein [Ornithinibacillus gellani]TQS70611.1 hypothetical protein DX933_17785 [Ornithinibacillus gellani]
MFKKIGAVTALSAALLFGGAFQTSASAQAADTSANTTLYKVSVNGGQWQQLDNFDIQSFIKQYVAKFQWKNQNNNWKQEHSTQTEKPQAESKPVEKPAEKPVEKPAEKPEVEKPAQNQTQTPQPEKQPEQQEKPQAESSALNQFEQEVVELTNKERANYGLKPLQIDENLSKVAREKSRDMAVNGYFSHNSPTYGSPFDMMKNWGIQYNSAGENIAKGQRTPQEVVNAWMNSEGHRANILNGSFTHIGVGYVENGNVWTQQFIGK